MDDATDFIFMAGGFFLLLVAGVLVAVRFSDRLNRVFALFLFMRGSGFAVYPLHDATGQAVNALFALGSYLGIAAIFVLLYLATAYLDRFGRPGLRRPAGLFFTLIGVAITSTYIMGDWRFPGQRLVAFALLVTGPNLMAAILARDALATSDAGRRGSLLLASLGFAFHTTAWALHLFIPDLMRFDEPRKWIAAWSVLPLLYVVGRLVPAARAAEPRLRADARRYLALMGLVVASVLAIAIANVTLPGASSANLPRGLIGPFMVTIMVLWMIGFALIVAYSILRLEVFGFEMTTKLTVKRGTIAAAFLATFLVVSQLVEGWTEQAAGGLGTYSWVAGGLAAGALLFALSPLERLAARVAAVAVPEAGSGPAYEAYRRLQLYESAVRAAAEDGHLQAADRRMLDRLRTRLELARKDASAIEEQVLAIATKAGTRPA